MGLGLSEVGLGEVKLVGGLGKGERERGNGVTDSMGMGKDWRLETGKGVVGCEGGRNRLTFLSSCPSRYR